MHLRFGSELFALDECNALMTDSDQVFSRHPRRTVVVQQDVVDTIAAVTTG